MRFRFYSFCFLVVLLSAHNFSMAQSSRRDSIAVSKEKLKAQELSLDSAAWLRTDSGSVVQKKHSPRTATLLSLACPGLGQIYNRQYWKTPIILGFGVFFGIMISSNHFDYQQAKNDYKIRVENEADPIYKYDRENNTNLFDPTKYDAYDPNNLANAQNNIRTYNTYALRSTRDGYRRDRDFYIIMMGVVYALNIVDATVFAHLREFKMSEKLSMRIDPDIKLVNSSSLSAGLSCNFVLK